MSYNPNSDGRGRRDGWRGQSRGGSGGYQNDRNYQGDYQQGLGRYSQEPNYVPVTVGRLNVADEEASTNPPQQYQEQQRRGEFGGRSGPGRGRPYQQRHQHQGHGFEHLYRDGGGTRNQRSVANPFEGGYSLYGRELVPEPGCREDSGSSRPEEPNTTPVLSTASGYSVKFNGNTSRLQGRVERMSTEDMALQDREQNRPEKSEQEEERPRYRGGFGQRESQQDKHWMGIPQDGPLRPAQWHDRGYNRYQADREQDHGYQGGYEQRGAPPDRPQTGYTRGGFTRNRGRGGFRPGNQEVNEHDGDRVSVSQKRQEPRALAQTIPVYQKPHWQLQMEARRIVKAERKKQGILEHRKTNKKAFAQPETKKYENGVNGEGRSDYELGQKIPTFSDEEKEKDGKTCEHLHKIITKNDLTVDELLLAYLSVLLKKEEEPVLKTSEELVKFLENHGHVFLQKLGKSTIANRGFGYRRCMVYICCIILSQESDGQGVKISDVFDEIEALPTYTFEGPWNDDWIWNSTLTKTHLIKFFSQHSEIFELYERDGTVKITGSAKQVPTLWDSTILSLRPSPSKKEVYWDFSRVENFRGYVFATVNEYCCVRITAGYFKNRHVYCLASDMDLSFERFALLYPTGFEVVGSAHFTMHAKNEFRCLQLKVINPDTGLELVPRKPEVEEEEGPVITSKEEKDLFEKVHMRSVEEEDIVAKLDELIGVKKVKWDELEERRKNIENDENYKNMTMFSSADSLKTAFLIRPHLYKIHTLGVAVYSQEERDFKLRFLHHVCRVSTDEDKRLTMEELAASFGTKAVEEKLAQFTEVEKLEVAIKKLNGILEMKADAAGDPWTLLCFVDGVYYSKHKAFLPKFSPFV